MVFACVNQVVFSTEMTWMSGGRRTSPLQHWATLFPNKCSLAPESVGKVDFFAGCLTVWTVQHCGIS